MFLFGMLPKIYWTHGLVIDLESSTGENCVLKPCQMGPRDCKMG